MCTHTVTLLTTSLVNTTESQKSVLKQIQMPVLEN